MEKGRKLAAILLSVGMILNSLNPMSVQAEETEIIEDTVTEEEAELSYWEVLGEAETSAQRPKARSLEDGTVELKDSNEVEWIDRLDLTEVPEIRELYNDLEEASDNDGIDDFLIEDSYFKSTKKIEVINVTGTYKSGETMESVMNKVYAQYKPFISAAFCAFDRDHPEVFWLSGKWGTGVSISGGSTYYSVTVYLNIKTSSYDIRSDVYQSEKAIKTAIEQRDTKANTILSKVKDLEVYEKIAYFNEVLTLTNEYNTSSDLNTIAPDCRECTSALAGSTGTEGPVCEGYARAFKVLCDLSDIPCVLVDGQAINSSGVVGGHMWNYVEVDGSWYGMDVTWNDPVPYSSKGAVSGYECESWSLVGAETIVNGNTFLSTHPVENSVSSVVVAFTNGPVLNKREYVIPLETTLNLSAYAGTTFSKIFTYGDEITVKVTATAEGNPATTQKAELYYEDTKLAESSSPDKTGCYTFTYDTAKRGIPAGEDLKLTVKFAGGADSTGEIVMSREEGSISITLNAAKPEIAFGSESEDVEYCAEAVGITSPEVNLIGSDERTESFIYYYKLSEETEYSKGLPRNVGTYEVKAVLPASSDGYYAEAESKNAVTLTVQKKEINLTAAELSAYGREDKEEAMLYGRLDITGIFEEDLGEVSLSYNKDDLTGIFEERMPGEQKVILSLKNMPQLQGEKAGNYCLSEEIPEITGIVNAVSEETLSLNAEQYKLVKEEGISEIPDAFAENTKLNTPEKLVAEMILSVQDADAGIQTENIVVYNYELLIKNEENAWREVSDDEFPEEGLTISLPYPEETDGEVYDFIVTHLYEEDMNGYKAGEVEYPVVTETEEGIQFTVFGLGTIAVGWKEAAHELICPSQKFTDVDFQAWYHLNVDYVVENGIMAGTNTGTTFEPGKNITRAEIVLMMYRLSKAEVTEEQRAEVEFADVFEDAWFFDAVEWAAAEGIVNGTGNGKFSPYAEITREQLASMLYRYARWAGADTSAAANISGFVDSAKISGWAEEALSWAAAVQLIKGKNVNGVTMLAPLDPATRAEAAAVFERLCENVL